MGQDLVADEDGESSSSGEGPSPVGIGLSGAQRPPALQDHETIAYREAGTSRLRRATSLPALATPPMGREPPMLLEPRVLAMVASPSTEEGPAEALDHDWEAMDIGPGEEEEDDIDFWGGESPRAAGSRWFGGDMSMWDKDEDDGSDAQAATEGDLDGTSSHNGEDYDDDFGPGSIELIGHR